MLMWEARSAPASRSLFLTRTGIHPRIKSEGARKGSARGRGPGVEIARVIHAQQFLAAQVEHARGQSATLVDPFLHRRRIHRIKHVGSFGVGDRVTVVIEVPGRVKPERGVRRHAYLVVGNGAKDDGAG